MTESLFPDVGEHQNLPVGEQSGNTPDQMTQNPRSDPQSTVPQNSGNTGEPVPGVFPVSPPPSGGNGDPEPALVDLLEVNIELTETDEHWTVTFPTRSSYLRAQLRTKALLRIGQLLPGKPIRLNHQDTKEPKPSTKPLKMPEDRQ